MNHRALVSRLAAALIGLPATLIADVVPAPLFQDHAVLQRGKPIPVWGTADPGEKVTVTFAGQSRSATADAEGRWSVTLDPLEVQAEPTTLVIAGNNTITLSDILVGEVWLASGQSNMEWPVSRSGDHDLEIAASANPQIRHFHVRRQRSEVPLRTATGTWEAASPETTGDFTAVGYYFALDLQRVLRVPVGIVHSAWGGTIAEAWTDPETVATHRRLDYVTKEWEQALANFPENESAYHAEVGAWKKAKAEAEAAGKRFTERAPRPPVGPGHPHMPSGLYNGMIHPLTPYAIRGVIWYQGEGNSRHPERYHELFAAMIEGWRKHFAQGDFPFYWAQLTSYGSPTDTNWAFLREAQTKTLALPATGQAVTIDLGNARDIHPHNKKAVGRRLARLALSRDYGIDLVESGPTFLKAERDGSGFRVRFEHSGRGLIAPFNTLGGFELAGEDKVFHAADAEIEDDTVIVTSAEVPEPVAVRYAWRNSPEVGLFNRDGLPAAPFRTDNW